jgi:hypothetical protein
MAEPSDSGSRIGDRVGVGSARTFPPECLLRVHRPKFQSAAEVDHPPKLGVARTQGHEDQFPPPRLSAGCGSRKGTIAGMRRNARDAPIPNLPALAPEWGFDP